MRRLIPLATAASLVLGVLACASPALAYYDRGDDAAEGESQDVIASSRRVSVTENGRKFVLKIEFTSALDGFDLVVRLDSRGGDRADFRLYVWHSDGPLGCTIARTSKPQKLLTRCDVRMPERGPWRLVAREPVRTFKADKRIRWWIYAPVLYFPDDVPDRAPDHGWYPE